MQKIDLIGERFGRLTVIEEAPKVVYGKATKIRWYCRCDCGRTTITTSNNLRSGRIVSCGCNKNKDNHHRTHGLSNSRLFSIWENMKSRCKNSSVKCFKHYGGRGITVCPEWDNSFMSFYNWAVQNGYDDDLTIDRIDANGNYEPSNCRWVTQTEQIRNRRESIKVIFHGKEIPIALLAEEVGVKYTTLLFHYHKKDLEKYIEGRLENNGIKSETSIAT